MIKELIAVVTIVTSPIDSAIQDGVESITTTFTGVENACSERYINESRYNPTTLSDYQLCIVNEVLVDKDHGNFGDLYWVRVGDNVYTFNGSTVRTHGDQYVIDMITDQVIADLEADNAELQAQIDEIEALIDLGIDPDKAISHVVGPAEFKDGVIYVDGEAKFYIDSGPRDDSREGYRIGIFSNGYILDDGTYQKLSNGVWDTEQAREYIRQLVAQVAVDAYNQGYEDGYTDGYADGYEAGWNDAMDTLK